MRRASVPPIAASRGLTAARRTAGALAFGLVLPVALAVSLVACSAGAPPATPPIVPGSSTAPREVNVVMKDWIFLPDPIDVVPGETVLLHVVNGGLEVHELVIGDLAVQDAWEAAELAAINAPPGPTPAISVPPGLAGIRVVVASGQRVDLTWQVPASAADVSKLLFGCHIASHWAKGMHASVVIAGASAPPAASAAGSAGTESSALAPSAP